MAATQTFGRVKYLLANTLQHTAWDIRPSVYGVPPGPGVAGYEDYRVIQRQAGANMTVDVGTTAQTALGMTGWVTGSGRGHQGIYECATVDWTAPTTNSYVAQLNVDVAGNASGNPRLDLVVLEVLDLQHVGTGSSVQQIRVVTGTATATATLDNRLGAPALPASCIHLADILVPNAAASIVTADIRDRRAFPLQAVPPILASSQIRQVAFLPAGNWQSVGIANIDNAVHDLRQSAVLMYLPERIVAATRMRWTYLHTATAAVGNYILMLFDATGRQIVTTGSVAFTGALNTQQVRSETIAATTVEAGLYYVGIGIDTSAGACQVAGVIVSSSAALGSPATTGLKFGSATGGVTAPTTILSYLDINAGAFVAPPVPEISLSVG